MGYYTDVVATIGWLVRSLIICSYLLCSIESEVYWSTISWWKVLFNLQLLHIASPRLFINKRRGRVNDFLFFNCSSQFCFFVKEIKAPASIKNVQKCKKKNVYILYSSIIQEGIRKLFHMNAVNFWNCALVCGGDRTGFLNKYFFELHFLNNFVFPHSSFSNFVSFHIRTTKYSALCRGMLHSYNNIRKK